MRYWKNRPQELIKLLGVVSLVVFMLASGLTYLYVNHKINTNIQRDIALKSEYSSNRVKSIFENAKIHTSQMAINPLLNEYLLSVKSREDIVKEPNFTRVVQLLRAIKESSNTHYLAWVANEQGNFYFDNLGVPSDVSYDIFKRPWHAIAVGSKTVEFTPPYLEWGTGSLVFSSLQALRNYDDSIYGFVGIEVSIDTLPVIMNEAKLTSKDIMYMIGPDGSYIYHPDKSRAITDKITDTDDPLNAYSMQILTTRRGLWEVSYQGTAMFLVCYPASETGWIIVSLIPRNLIEKDMQQTSNMVLLIIGCSVFALFLTAAYFINKSAQLGSASYTQSSALLEEEIQSKNIELAMQYHHIIEHEKMASLGNLVPGVTHEVNTPLGNCISTMTYLDKINSDLTEKLAAGSMTKGDLKRFMEENAEGLELLNVNLNRATDLIKSFKQMAVDQSSDQQSLFDLKETIQAVALSLKHEYKTHGHSVAIDCPDGLLIDSYPGVYIQIFTNFIMNSIRHGFKERDKGRMQFHCHTAGERLIIVYSDDGCGIPPENIDRIFDMFFTTNRSHGNNGLGMHIVQTLIRDKLMGHIQCDSKQGQGVVFTIDVPLQIEKQI